MYVLREVSNIRDRKCFWVVQKVYSYILKNKIIKNEVLLWNIMCLEIRQNELHLNQKFMMNNLAKSGKERQEIGCM